MEAVAVVTQDLWLAGDLSRWRRTTGVPRALLSAAPLFAWTHHEDVSELVVASEVARWRPAYAEVRLGTRERVRCAIELGRWTEAGLAYVVVRALDPRPVSAWWLPEPDFARLPPMPRTPSVSA